MTRALVTGIGGQDGSYLAERLLADGVEVHALVLESDARPAHCPADVVLHVGDVADVEATRRLVLDLAPDEVYNLAAISSVAQSWQEPDLVSRVNGDRRPSRCWRAPACCRSAAATSASSRPPAPRSSASPTAPRRTRTPGCDRSTRTARRRPTRTSRSA